MADSFRNRVREAGWLTVIGTGFLISATAALPVCTYRIWHEARSAVADISQTRDRTRLQFAETGKAVPAFGRITRDKGNARVVFDMAAYTTRGNTGLRSVTARDGFIISISCLDAVKKKPKRHADIG